MWHEARKQEKLIKGMIVDYRRRAERRRDFYEKIKADPTQFLQVHGRPCKIHLDPAVAASGEGPAIMMPWQGDPENMIDRFDVRAHLDYIPDVVVPDTADDLNYEERHCNYERYRILAQNLFLGISEEKFLHQLSIEEKYGVTLEEKEAQREKAEKKGTGVAIGFDYDAEVQPPPPPPVNMNNDDANDDSDEESDPEIIDVDLSIDVNKIETSQAHAMNTCGANFGMPSTDFFSFLTGDADEVEKSKQLMREEKEKALFSGRKSRRERRAHRDKKLALRVVSPPHYAARPPSPKQLSPSPTRSPSPSLHGHQEKITFITSFGGEEEHPATSPEKSTVTSQRTYAAVLKDGKKRLRSPSPRRSKRSPIKYSRSKYSRKSLSRSRSKSRRSRSYSSRSRSISRSRLRSRSIRSHSKSDSSRSKSKSNLIRRSRSSGSSRSRSRRRSRSSSGTSRSSSRDNRRHYGKSKYSTAKNNNSSSNTQQCGSTSHPVQIPKYYGRKRDGVRSSSSELSVDSESDDDSETRNISKDKMTGGKTSHVSNVVHNSGASSKHWKEGLTAKERLKRKMQVQLSRQLRADMKAEADRQEREQLLQQERDDEMRELAIKIRRRQRELRHQRYSQSSNEGSSSPHHSRRSPRYRSRDQSSEEEKTNSRQSEKIPETRQEKYSKRQEEDAPYKRHHNTPGHSNWLDSKCGRSHSDLRLSGRQGYQDIKEEYGSSHQSRSFSKHQYRRDEEYRNTHQWRHNDHDQSGRHWQSREKEEDQRQRYRSDDHEKSRSRSSGKGAEEVVKYSNRKLVDY